MQTICSRTCGFCALGSCLKTRFGCCPDGVTESLGVKFFGCPEPCRDTLHGRFCKSIKKSGYCTHPSFRDKCTDTCGKCLSCVDQDPHYCKTITDYGLCEKLKHVATTTCKRSCRKCGRNDPCFGFICENGSNCTVDHKGKAFCACNNLCKADDHVTGLVCGRDSKTYESLCKLKQTSCNNVSQVGVKHYGKCKQLVLDNTVAFPSCETSKYGCCLDGKTEATDLTASNCVKDCPKDRYETLCNRFTAVCGGSNGNHVNERFMKYRCPVSCRYCVT